MAGMALTNPETPEKTSGLMTFVRDDLRSVQRRLAVLLVGALVLLTLLGVRLWVLQVTQAARWQRAAENNRLRRVPLEAPRGTVTDRHGEVLLGTRPAFQLLLFPEELVDREETVRFLAGLQVAGDGELENRFERASRTSHLPSVIADDLSWRQVAAIAAHKTDYPALEVHPATRRFTPEGPIIAHLAGQLSEANPEQIAANPRLRPGQLVGRSGLEAAYDHVLGGTPGNLIMVVDALGRQVSQVDQEPPEPGKPMQITLDMALQREAWSALQGESGAVVGLDPRTGAVRILVSQPSFDPGMFAGRVTPERWRELIQDPLRPLNNRALQALYPPGSTMKPLYIAGALLDEVRTPRDSTFCSGAVTLHGHTYRCWLAGGHGRVAMEAAVEVSCDSYFYHLARDAGLERLALWSQLFGLGQATGIELAGESRGLVPSDEWSRRVRGHPWFAGETISVGIGQGPILTTPIQLAVAYAALVNGGFLVQPHLTADRARPAKPLDIPEQILEIAQRSMERVVLGERGTARRHATGGIPFAGKTGTSQVVRKRDGVHWRELPREHRHHALFVGYAPLDDPQLVVAVVVEHGGEGSAAAAPVAARVLRRAFGQPAPATEAPGGNGPRPEIQQPTGSESQETP